MALAEQVRLAVEGGVTDPAAIAKLIGEPVARVVTALRATPEPVDSDDGEE